MKRGGVGGVGASFLRGATIGFASASLLFLFELQFTSARGTDYSRSGKCKNGLWVFFLPRSEGWMMGDRPKSGICN